MKSKKKVNFKINPGLAFLSFLSAVFVVLALATYRPVVVNEIGNFSGEFEANKKTALFNGKNIGVEKYDGSVKPNNVLGTTNSNKWIEVDLSDQRLKAWEGDSLFLETPVSTGLPWWPTPKGEFNIWLKLRYTRMKGGQGKYAYDLPNVPYTMFFESSEVPGWRGYGLHGTYWHNNFGTPRSHGCVNLPTPMAEKLFYWTTPTLTGKSSSVSSSEDNPGTRIVIHE